LVETNLPETNGVDAMGTWQGVNPYPSIGEFSGLYNIPDQYDDIGPVLRSDDDLPEFGFPELWEVYNGALKWFAEAFRSPPPQPAYVPVHDETFQPVCEADDRHLLVELIDYDRLTVPLLRQMQMELLGRFPLWRIQLQGCDADSDILVYPKVIRFGNQPVDVDPEEALRKLVSYAKPLREAGLEAQRAQFAFLRHRLPAAVREIGDRPFFIFAVLASFDRDPSRLAICLLVRGADSDVVKFERPPGAGLEFFSVASAYYVDAAGTFVPDADAEPAFCIRLWLPLAEYRGPLTLVEKLTGERHVYEVRSEAITHLSAVG
jgi:hypothetical protein